MFQKERLDNILKYIQKNGYVTTRSLVENLHYSIASINRDLNVLARQGHIKRSYGGVEFIERKYTPYKFRQHKQKEEKERIAKKAAEFIEDGDTIFISASTTNEYMIPYLLNKKNLHVITNNMYLACTLSEMHVKVTCLGGTIVEFPYFLGGSDTIENANRHGADKFFFTTSSFTDDGRIGTGQSFYNMYLAMKNNSDKTFYLTTSDKLTKKTDIKLFFHDFSKMDYIISDYEFSDELKKSCPDTEFIKV